MKRKLYALLALTICASISLAGCGSGASANANPAGTANTANPAAAASDGQTYELHVAYAVAEMEDGLHTVAVNAFKNEVEEKTEGKVKIVVHPGGELGGEREYIEMLQTGDLAFASISTSVVSGFSDALKLYDMPMLFDTTEQLDQFTRTDIAKQRLDKLKEIDIEGLAVVAAGARNFLTGPKYEIRTPDDIKELKMRVMETPLQIEGMTLLGAQATPMPYSECFQSLQTGVIDGMENQLDAYMSSRLYEVAPNFSEVNWFQLAHILLGSEKALKNLPEEYREIIRVAGQNAGETAAQYGMDYDKGKGLEKLKEANVNLIQPDRDAFLKLLAPMKEKHKDMIGQDVLDWIAENK